VVERLTIWHPIARMADIPAQAPNIPAAPEAPGSPQAPATGVAAETPAPNRIIINGKDISVDGGDGTVTTTGFPFPTDVPPGVQSIATTAIVSFAFMIAAFPVFSFLKALVNRRASTQAMLPSRDTTDRLQRIEAAVEAMSVEVERISEGQRFVTRVLAERSSAPS
jgi:hypothetical protein